MARNTVSSDDLFTVCAHQYGYAKSVARVLSNLLFWSQFAQNYFRGHIGIYKTDGELAENFISILRPLTLPPGGICACGEGQAKGCVSHALRAKARRTRRSSTMVIQD